LQRYNSLFSNNKAKTLINQIEDYILSLKNNQSNHIYLLYSKHMKEDVLNAYAVAMLFLILHNYKKNWDIVNSLADSIISHKKWLFGNGQGKLI